MNDNTSSWADDRVLLTDDEYRNLYDEFTSKINRIENVIALYELSSSSFIESALDRLAEVNPRKASSIAGNVDDFKALPIARLEVMLDETTHRINALTHYQDIPFEFAARFGKRLALTYREKYPINRATKIEYTQYERWVVVTEMFSASVFDPTPEAPLYNPKQEEVNFELWAESKDGPAYRIGYVAALNTIYIYRPMRR